MKNCFKCGEEKELSEFYRHPRMSDGHLNKCKECTKNDVAINKSKNADYYREYERERAKLPHRVEARKAYAKTEKGKEAHKRGSKKWLEKNQIKRAANIIVGNAIRDGKLTKQTCEVCGKEDVHAHHPDYAYPLDVMWLCPTHHAEWHKENGEGKNG